MQLPTDVVLHGIKSCDSCRAALRWLRDHGVAHQFRDLRQDAPQRTELVVWLERLGPELLNRKSSSWRQLPESLRIDVDADRTIELLLGNPTLMKRPLLEWSGGLLLGFDPDLYQRQLR
ncbi:MAG: Spx/MgsR family RNA polymerase-binding regulatory protein [Pseudomonadales bacterium]|nr:Spx/MgsR family RNA polymerase-binding regulatory protein [Pseudomonadales bacterium]MCP5333447.1 Spx/MgsR family RNA polymerase-binding regulatory protein [Pseudomonadales bacterium]HMU89156.1 Spx/MgsR family RNA polymerase-binding regulatory protein [Pseudomonadales bacterium]HMZ91024.1 Spx/MgsR family RNA polymerase-binding regulatory protein [Pseudomonadales bacterium]HND27862.1 Spx/MgsR family RNA polymerase-binding regulatory protein [Pseudomonadales bacterium]